MDEQHGRKVGGGVTIGLGVLVVWLLGYFGVALSAEVGTVVGALVIAFWTAVWEEGLTGFARHVWRGRGHASSTRSASGEAQPAEDESGV